MKLTPLLIMSVFGLSTFSSAQIFEASGIGHSPEQAKKDAINNAIKFSVGEFIVNKEELHNDSFTQSIVSHSNAYVNKIDVISQIKLPNGEYEAKVSVDIESQKLLGQLKDMHVAVAENVVDNESMLKALNYFEKVDTEQKMQEDFKALVNELLVKPIEESKSLIDLKIIAKLQPFQEKDFEKYNIRKEKES